MSKDKRYLVWYEYAGTDPEILKDIEEDPYRESEERFAANLTELSKKVEVPAEDNVLKVLDASLAKTYKVESTLKELK